MSVAQAVIWTAVAWDVATLCGAVFLLRVAARLRDERLRLAELRASIGEPVAYRRDDGHISVEWPSEQTRHCLVARELLDQIVDELNAARGVS